MEKKNKIKCALFSIFLIFAIGNMLTAKQKEIIGDQQIEQKTSSNKQTKTIESAKIAPFGEVLFTIYGNLGAVNVKKRAEFIEKNIISLKKDAFCNPELINIVSENGTLDIVYLDKTILTITDKEAYSLEKSKEEIASEYLAIIIKALKKQRSEYMWFIILRQLILAIFIILATYFLIKYIDIFYKYLKRKFSKEQVKVNKFISNIIDVKKQKKIIIIFINILRIILIMLIYCIAGLTFLGLFPETKGVAIKAINFIIIPIKTVFIAFWNYLPDLFSIILITAVSYFISKILKIIATKIEQEKIVIKGFQGDWAAPTYRIIWFIVVIFTFIFIFPHLPNSESSVFKGISVFFGVLISLGSTSFISNIVSGFVITYMSPFKVGDHIKMGEHLGTVIQRSGLVTRIRTLKNEIVTIPNSIIMTAHTINYTNSANEYGLVLYSKVTVGYEIEWKKVHELLIEAGNKTPNILKHPSPFVLQLALGDLYVEYQINVYTNNANEMPRTYSNLHENIQDIFNREGIELMSPFIHTHRNAEKIYIPPQYRKLETEKNNSFNIVTLKNNNNKDN